MYYVLLVPTARLIVGCLVNAHNQSCPHAEVYLEYACCPLSFYFVSVATGTRPGRLPRASPLELLGREPLSITIFPRFHSRLLRLPGDGAQTRRGPYRGGRDSHVLYICNIEDLEDLEVLSNLTRLYRFRGIHWLRRSYTEILVDPAPRAPRNDRYVVLTSM